MSQKQPHDVCGAETRKGTPCQQPAGWGTDHFGTGRCKLHGGASKGPGEKNKNAVKTGEHETIWLDTLDDDEKEMYDKIRTDVAEQLDEEIKLTTIRERRMMKRIQKLRREEFTTVERKSRSGHGPEGPVDIQESKQKATLGQIQDIEEALTRVQSRKARLIKIKHQVEKGEGPINVDVTQYINALEGTAEEVWGDEE